jgi:TP901 family phage tail tape measure protein
MADLEKTIEILFSGTDAGLGRATQNAGRQIEGLSQSVGSVTGPVSDWTKSLLQAELALVGAGAAMAGLAVTQAGKFRESTVEIGTLFNGTAEQVEALQEQILEYSKNSTSSLDEINKAVYQAISTGTDWADAVEYAAKAEVLATAGREDLSTVTTLLSGAMNAYGDSVDKANDYSDVLFTTVKKGATSLPELAQSLSGVTSIAAAAKVPFADVNAAIAALTAGGTGTAESVTKLKALLTELLKPSDELAQALGGVTLEGDGLDGVMRQLLDVTGGSAEEMTKLFGSTEAVQAALVLANDSAGKYNDALKAMADRSGAALTASEKFALELDNINQKLMNRIQAMFVEAGMPILDTYAEVIDGIGQLFNGISFSIKDGAFKEVYESIENGGERITKLLQGIAKALPDALKGLDFDVLLTSFDRLNTELGDLFGSLDLTKPEDLQKAIQALINGVAALTNYSASAVEGMGPLIRTLADLIDQANDGDSSLLNFIGKLMGATTAVNALLPVLELVANAMILLGGARALGAVVPSMATFATVAGSSVKVMALLVNPVTLLAAGLGVLAYNFNDVVTYVEEYISSLLDLETRAQRNTKETEALAKVFQEGAKAMKGTSDEAWKTAEALWGNKDAAEGAAGAIGKASDAVEGESEALKAYRQIAADTEMMRADFAARTEERTKEQAKAQEEYRNQIMGTLEQYGNLTRAEFDLLEAAEQNEYVEAKRVATKAGWIDASGNAVSAMEKEAKALEKEEQLRKEASKALFEQTQQTLNFQLALEKIYSDERIKSMELEFSLNIEEVKQNAETARAIIETIGETVNSTGETLTGLAELLTGFSSTSSSGYREIMEIIQNEETRRDEAIKMQQEITRAQVEQMDAQTALLRQRADAYARGDAAITINGEGLQPHLEAFMWEILETIQTRVNAEGHAMLLGT